MYSLEERLKAVLLYIKLRHSAKAVKRELGYPDSARLRAWYLEFINNGNKLHEKRIKWQKYTEEQKQQAIEYYKSHNVPVSQCIKDLGFANRIVLAQWLDEAGIKRRRHCKRYSNSVISELEIKNKAILEVTAGNAKASDIADMLSTKAANIHQWCRKLFGKDIKTMRTKKINSSSLPMTKSELHEEIAKLAKEAEILKQQVFKLQLEKDLLEKAAELIKKDKGINLKMLTNKEKAILIDALRNKYKLSYLLKALGIAKSSYCYQRLVLRQIDKYAEIRKTIKQIFIESKETYGYRRIHYVLKNDNQTILSEKIIRRLIIEEKLKIRKPQKQHYSSYKGELTPGVKNLIKRDFHAVSPNKKWLTDITEFSIPSGKIYLSPIIDCFDGMPVSWTIGTSPNADLANTMLKKAILTLKSDEHPILHSDRGIHYRWPDWIKLVENAGIIRSMSKKGCSPDNSACEGFFGRLKCEMFYGRQWSGISVNKFIETLNEYLAWYCEKRIKITLGGLSPIQYRKQLGLIPS